MQGESGGNWSRLRPALAFLALFSGIALLLNILLTIDLRVGLSGLAAIVGLAFVTMLRRTSRSDRRAIGRTIGYCAFAGVLATLAYDAARTLLSAVDPSPYRPFEAIIRFGQLLLATDARSDAVVLAGALFHVLNGAAFGVAFGFLLARDGHLTMRRAVALGTGWGIFLELFQIALYPNWLGVRYYSEFVTISAMGHVAYGATLGAVSRSLLRRGGRGEPDV